jgi:hypothetical protein
MARAVQGGHCQFEQFASQEFSLIVLFVSLVISYGLPTLSQASAPAYVPRAMTYSAESAQIIRLDYGQTVAVKKLSKIEKAAIKLSQWVH